MNRIELTFEQSPWELALDKLKTGDRLCAVRFLTLMEGEEEAAVEDALQTLEDKRITLDISNLPKVSCTGELAQRLRLEEQLVRQGKLPEGLEAGDPLRIYLEEIAATPAAGDLDLLAERFASGEEAAAAMLVNVSLSLVIQEAYQMTGRGVLLLDLIQEGSLGLWQGVLNWSGGDFTEHSLWWIRQSLAKTVTMQARASGVGQRMKDLVAEYCAADKRLLTQLGRTPTLEEIALELGLSCEDAAVVEKMLISARTVQNGKQTASPDQEETDDNQAVEDTAYFQSRQRVLDMLSELTEQEAQVLTLRFGLEGGLPLSPQETGNKLGLTSLEVVNMEAAALGKLRKERG